MNPVLDMERHPRSHTQRFSNVILPRGRGVIAASYQPFIDVVLRLAVEEWS